MKAKRKSSRFFAEEGFLFRKGFKQSPLRYLSGDDVVRVLKEVYVEVRGEHQGGLKLFKRMVHLGYYWSIVEANDASFVEKYQYVSSLVTEFMLLQLNYRGCLYIGHSTHRSFI